MKETNVNQEKLPRFIEPRTELDMLAIIVKQNEQIANSLIRIEAAIVNNSPDKNNAVDELINTARDIKEDLLDDGKRNRSNHKRK